MLLSMVLCMTISSGDDIMPFMKKKFANLRTKSIKALSKYEVELWGQKPSN